ncbi:hypothetical protein ACLB2K_016042 [Fragaria x ananassa]
MEETRRDCYRDEYDYAEEEFQSRRGRERMSRMPSRHVNASIRKGTRSLSPLRIPDIMFDDVVSPAPTTSHASNSSIKPATSPSVSSAYNTILSAISFSKVNKKWKLRDMLLFRSASEGRATTGKDPLRKYSLLSTKKSMSEDVKNSSFRSTDSVGSVSSRRRGPVSPHELHYTVNRAVTEEMRRKTVLPYKHGLLGCLGFNHGLHEISRDSSSNSNEMENEIYLRPRCCGVTMRRSIFVVFRRGCDREKFDSDEVASDRSSSSSSLGVDVAGARFLRDGVE